MFRKQDFDLILMDCQMPVLDGLEAARAIRALESGAARVPIIAVTANALVGQREKCLDAGMDDYLAKPITKEALETTIQKWLSHDRVLTAV
jgi:CheY-like chemotaxis protein